MHLVDLQALHISAVHVSEHVALLEHVAALGCAAVAHACDLKASWESVSDAECEGTGGQCGLAVGSRGEQ
jgi:hypothetical protein